MNSAKVNVWCTMSKTQIIGLYFFEDGTINQHNYLQLLKNYLQPTLQKKRLVKKAIFQQDGAPAHFSRQVRAWLDENFNGRWIGRGGPISWTPRSPNLTPLDFFLLGFIKTRVYTRKISDIDDLKNKIAEEIKSIRREKLQNIFDTVLKRLKICIDVNGNTFEQYL